MTWAVDGWLIASLLLLLKVWLDGSFAASGYERTQLLNIAKNCFQKFLSFLPKIFPLISVDRGSHSFCADLGRGLESCLGSSCLNNSHMSYFNSQVDWFLSFLNMREVNFLRGFFDRGWLCNLRWEFYIRWILDLVGTFFQCCCRLFFCSNWPRVCSRSCLTLHGGFMYLNWREEICVQRCHSLKEELSAKNRRNSLIRYWLHLESDKYEANPPPLITFLSGFEWGKKLTKFCLSCCCCCFPFIFHVLCLHTKYCV